MNNELKERADIITKDALHRPPEMCIGDSQYLRMELHFISHNLEVGQYNASLKFKHIHMLGVCNLYIGRSVDLNELIHSSDIGHSKDLIPGKII